MIYLAAPYSHKDPRVVAERIKIFCHVDAKLHQHDVYTVSPLLKELIRINIPRLPGDWHSWGNYSTELLQRCTSLYVIMLYGWRQSTGVQQEIIIAKNRRIPIEYIEVIWDHERSKIKQLLYHAKPPAYQMG